MLLSSKDSSGSGESECGVRHVVWLGLIFPVSLEFRSHSGMARKKEGFPGSSDGKESTCSVGDPGSILESGRSLEEEMATLSSILAWPRGCKELDMTERVSSPAM